MKNIIIGIAIFIIIIFLGIFIKYVKDSNLSIGDKSFQYDVKPKSLVITGFSGVKLEKINLEGEELPLIKIPLVTWGGYAALIAANGGIKPSKSSLFYKNGKFVVELIRDEDPNSHIQGFASGKYPIIWSTMDMLPLLYNALKYDKRVIPQVFGIFDWSFGGDGIIVRGNIKTPKDLKGKKIVTSGNTPSHFFLLWILAQAGLQPADVFIKYVDDAVLAKDVFIKDKSIDGCVTWSPFVYELTDPNSKSYVKDSRILVTSKDANQLIADCYLTRYDFIREYSNIIYAFSKSIMEGFDLFENNKQRVYNIMADLFQLQGGPNEAAAMLGDVHIANFAENLMFFDTENPISASKIFYLSQEYYKNLGSLPSDASYEPEIVINTKPLEFLKSKKLFENHVNRIKNSFNQMGSFNIADLESKRVVLSRDINLYFEPQRIDFDFDSTKEEIMNNKKELKLIAEQMEVLGTTIVKLIGHLDTTKVAEFKAQGQQVFIEASAQAKLISKRRAEFVKKLLVEKYKCDPQRIITEGKGWDMPVDPNDQSKNRRVEVKFLSFE